jgi:hypothetical protein
MSDQPQIDNPQDINLRFPLEKNQNFSPLDLEQPGPETGSTAFDLNKISGKQGGQDEKLIQALMQDIQNEKPPPIDKKPELKTEPKKNIDQQRGFLTPFVNGINGLLDGIWNALKSLIPMKK